MKKRGDYGRMGGMEGKRGREDWSREGREDWEREGEEKGAGDWSREGERGLGQRESCREEGRQRRNWVRWGR